MMPKNAFVKHYKTVTKDKIIDQFFSVSANFEKQDSLYCDATVSLMTTSEENHNLKNEIVAKNDEIQKLKHGQEALQQQLLVTKKKIALMEIENSELQVSIVEQARANMYMSKTRKIEHGQ